MTKRERIFLVLSDGSGSKLSKAISYYFDILVVISIVALCFQTILELRHRHNILWFALETCISGQFLGRLVLKLCTCPSDQMRPYICSWTFAIDLITIAPWPIELTLFLMHPSTTSQISNLRFLRVMRFARLMQCAWMSTPELKLFSKALRRSRAAFLFLAGYGTMGLLCFSWVVYLVETSVCKVVDGKTLMLQDGSGKCPLQNIFEAIWMCLCTVITVGYGDFVPQGALSKSIVSVLMLCGYIMLPLPVTIFGANLTELYLEARGAIKMKKLARHPVDPSETDASEIPSTSILSP